ncbi:MAG: glycosyltransferase [Flavisolibacter sp.]
MIAPLDWGLGHATRSIPVINALLRHHSNVLIGAEGTIKILLEKEFPQLEFIDLKGYNINYSKNKWTLPFVLASQVPKILSVIKYENERLAELVKAHSIDGVISDNRFGLYHENIASVFITHQLRIKTQLGSQADDFLQRLNYNYINRFSQCWVPDVKESMNLSGELSHPSKDPAIPVKFVGPLSRFSYCEGTEKHVLILLSGPEPQRSILEEIILSQVNKLKTPVVLVRGLPGNATQIHVPSNVTVFDHLPAKELQQQITSAGFVISRCGYSTVMDLALTRKKSILIPTPGQTEQEYLARHLQQINFALCIDQKKFKLKNALDLASSFNYRTMVFNSENLLEKRVKEFLILVKEKERR